MPHFEAFICAQNFIKSGGGGGGLVYWPHSFVSHDDDDHSADPGQSNCAAAASLGIISPTHTHTHTRGNQITHWRASAAVSFLTFGVKEEKEKEPRSKIRKTLNERKERDILAALVINTDAPWIYSASVVYKQRVILLLLLLLFGIYYFIRKKRVFYVH